MWQWGWLFDRFKGALPLQRAFPQSQAFRGSSHLKHLSRVPGEAARKSPLVRRWLFKYLTILPHPTGAEMRTSVVLDLPDLLK